MESLGSKLKQLRLKNNLTQLQLAEKLFVSDKTISSWECDRTIPEINMLFGISSIFNISLYSLIDTNYTNQLPLEIEVKLKVDEREYKRIFGLVKSSSIDIKEVKQIDSYYIPTYEGMNSEWLRIRNEDNKCILTLKKKVNDTARDEFESMFDNQKNLECILKNIGFVKKGIIDKTRIKVMYKDKYEIAFDNVSDIGYFVEIEVKSFDGDEKEEIDNLINVLKELKIDLKLIDVKKYFDYL